MHHLRGISVVPRDRSAARAAIPNRVMKAADQLHKVAQDDLTVTHARRLSRRAMIAIQQRKSCTRTAVHESSRVVPRDRDGVVVAITQQIAPVLLLPLLLPLRSLPTMVRFQPTAAAKDPRRGTPGLADHDVGGRDGRDRRHGRAR